MAERSREDEALVAKSAAQIIDRLGDRLVEVTRTFQELLVRAIPEIAAGGGLVQVLHDSAQGNLDAFFVAIRHDISIDQIEPPTAALEHARRLAQRGVSANGLVGADRLGPPSAA